MRDTATGSKLLSLVLRHRPELVGIELDERGWVPVPTLLEALSARGRPMARAELDEMVRCNDKQRFELDTAADRIRARQGHSMPVDLALEPVDPPAVLFHGTPVGNLGSIHADGLDRRRRHHVHLSPDPVTAHQVGARRGRPVVLAVRRGRDGLRRAPVLEDGERCVADRPRAHAVHCRHRRSGSKA